MYLRLIYLYWVDSLYNVFLVLKFIQIPTNPYYPFNHVFLDLLRFLNIFRKMAAVKSASLLKKGYTGIKAHRCEDENNDIAFKEKIYCQKQPTKAVPQKVS